MPVSVPGGPYTIVSGQDGNLWFTWGEWRIGRMSPEGAVTEFRLSSVAPKPIPIGIAAGPDGNLWFTEAGSNKIGRMTTSGVVTEFPLPPPGRRLGMIAAGPDGNLWFTEQIGAIGRITPSGTVTEFPLPAPGGTAFGIARGPDGNLWFTIDDRIGRITPAGVITEFPVPTPSAGASYIVAGPDGALWFTEVRANKIGRITTSGEITEFLIPTPGSEPQGIVAGPDGRLYFAESVASQIGRITTAGVIDEFSIPVAYYEGVTVGPDGAIWLALYQDDALGRLSIEPFDCVAGPDSLCLNGGRFRVQVDWRVPSQNRTGSGMAVPLTGDTGYFWFFDSDNVELVVKALDGSSLNDHFWIFYGALSGVEYTMTVTDSRTGLSKRYFNPSGTLASVADTSAFAASAAASGEPGMANPVASKEIDAHSAESLYGMFAALAPSPRVGPSPAAACAPGGTTLCLNQGRFEVRVDWSIPSQSRSGSGMAVPVTADTGYLWFFSETNVELIVKVLDGRSVNGHFWVFYGALSNVQYTIRVTDRETGAIKTYENPSGTLASHADIAAF
jgi:streptogramin lyase